MRNLKQLKLIEGIGLLFHLEGKERRVKRAEETITSFIKLHN